MTDATSFPADRARVVCPARTEWNLLALHTVSLEAER